MPGTVVVGGVDGEVVAAGVFDMEAARLGEGNWLPLVVGVPEAELLLGTEPDGLGVPDNGE